MKTRVRAFTLVEMLVVIFIIAVIAALLLPALSAAKKRALSRSLSPAASAVAPVPSTEPASAMSQRTLASVRSFSATVALKPELSVGTVQPESIYTAQLKAAFQALNPAGSGECEVQLPLLPQIISLADLNVTIDGRASESVEIRGDKLVWFGTLSAEPSAISVAYSAVGKGIYLYKYFAQEFIPLDAAILISSVLVLAIIAVRSMTIMGPRLALLGIVLPAAAVLAITIVAAIQVRLQGLLITGTGLMFFIVAMSLMPRLKLENKLPVKTRAMAGP